MSTARGIDGSARRVGCWRHLRAVLLLPAMNTLFIPSVLLGVFGDARLGSATLIENLLAILLALPLLATGLALVLRSIMLFVRHGRGTLAPWDPTECLLTQDVYRLSRNPMKAGLFLVLIGESLLLRSPAIAVWAAVFVTVNVFYIRWFEEPGLVRRFGEAYLAYCRQVPRWLPLPPFGAPRGDCAGRLS